MLFHSMLPLLKGVRVPNISDAISDVLSPIILNNRVHVVSTGMPDRLLAVARRVSKGAHQVAHLPRGGKTAQVKVLVLACLTDFPAIHVSSSFKIAGSMGPLDSVDATDGLDHGILDLRVPRITEYWTYKYPGILELEPSRNIGLMSTPDLPRTSSNIMQLLK
jgi:hypothetical protein